MGVEGESFCGVVSWLVVLFVIDTLEAVEDGG